MSTDDAMTRVTRVPVHLSATSPRASTSTRVTRVIPQPADHLTVALTHLDSDDLASVQWTLARIGGNTSDPRALRLLVALLAAVQSEQAHRRGDPPTPTADRFIFGEHPTPIHESDNA